MIDGHDITASDCDTRDSCALNGEQLELSSFPRVDQSGEHSNLAQLNFELNNNELEGQI